MNWQKYHQYRAQNTREGTYHALGALHDMCQSARRMAGDLSRP